MKEIADHLDDPLVQPSPSPSASASYFERVQTYVTENQIAREVDKVIREKGEEAKE